MRPTDVENFDLWYHTREWSLGTEAEVTLEALYPELVKLIVMVNTLGIKLELQELMERPESFRTDQKPLKARTVLNDLWQFTSGPDLTHAPQSLA